LLLGPAIDKVTNEDHFSFWMPEHASDLRIIEFGQKPIQGIGVTMNVPNDVVSGIHQGWFSVC